MNTSTTVLIAGAGPTGLVAALTLLKNGISVRVIEKDRTPRRGQRGTGNYPRTLEVYNFLDIPEVFEQADDIQLFHTHTFGSVDVLKEFNFIPDAADPTPSIPFNRPLVLSQSILERILRSHLEKFGCAVEYGKELCSFKQDENRVVAELMTGDSTNEVTETVDAQFLIGADGARGVTRKLLDITFLGEIRETTRLVTGDVQFKCPALTRERTHHFSDSDGSMALVIPTGQFGNDDGWQFLVSGDKIDTEKLVSSKEAFFSCIRDIIGSPVEFIDLVWISHFRPNIRMANTFGNGRVFVAGDAAHIHSPTGGQGLNSGVQDGFHLAWKISLVAKGLSPLSLLDTYTTERLPVIAQMLNLTTALLDKTLGPNQVAAENAWQRGRILFMLGVNYRASPIVLDEFSSGVPPVPAYGVEISNQLVAGDRAPDAPGLLDGEHTVRLFGLFKPSHHTAMVFASDVQAAEEVVSFLAPYSELGIVRTVVILPAGANPSSTLDATSVLVDEGSYARTHYFVDDRLRVVIVRPDGIVGAIVAGSSGVQKYFGLIICHQ